jgi:hypothetical protein
MHRSLLSALALISLLALVVLAFGCVATFGPAYLHNVVSGPNPHVLDVELVFQRGRIAIYWEVWNNPPATATIPLGTHLYWHPARFRLPDLRRMGWAFDAHPLVLPPNNPWVFLFAFPIWCIAIPFLIAPVMWLRGRKAPELAGFSVIQGSEAKLD